MKLDLWERRADFMVAQIDDSDVVLKMEFLLTHHIILMLTANSLMIMDEDPCIVPIQTKKPKKTSFISTL